MVNNPYKKDYNTLDLLDIKYSDLGLGIQSKKYIYLFSHNLQFINIYPPLVAIHIISLFISFETKQITKIKMLLLLITANKIWFNTFSKIMCDFCV